MAKPDVTTYRDRMDKAVGALGPVEAFGLDALVSGCLALGLAEQD